MICVGGDGYNVQIKELVNTTKKEITKLLLRGCSCKNCKFLNSDSTKWWCKNKKREPIKSVCITWEKNPFDLSDLFDVVRTGYPVMAASDLVKTYPMMKATANIFNLVYSYGQKNNKKTSKK